MGRPKTYNDITTISITIEKQELAKIDAARGGIPRGKFISLAASSAAELTQKIVTLEKEIAELMAKIKNFDVSGQEHEKARLEYLLNHLYTLADFEKGLISAEGYRRMQVKLNFDSTRKVKEWLRAQHSKFKEEHPDYMLLTKAEMPFKEIEDKNRSASLASAAEPSALAVPVKTPESQNNSKEQYIRPSAEELLARLPEKEIDTKHDSASN